jgi:hypothetical protein
VIPQSIYLSSQLVLAVRFFLFFSFLLLSNYIPPPRVRTKKINFMDWTRRTLIDRKDICRMICSAGRIPAAVSPIGIIDTLKWIWMSRHGTSEKYRFQAGCWGVHQYMYLLGLLFYICSRVCSQSETRRTLNHIRPLRHPKYRPERGSFRVRRL